MKTKSSKQSKKSEDNQENTTIFLSSSKHTSITVPKLFFVLLDFGFF